MTIEAKLVGTPTGGHGLTEDILEAVWGELIKGKSAGLIPALVLLQPEDFTGKAKKNGKRVVKLLVVRLEPVTDATDADRIRMAITEAYEARHESGQGALDLGEEEARRLLGYIDEWRKGESLTIGMVGVKWREMFGPDSGVPGDYRKASPIHLREFALANGVLPDEVVGAESATPTET